MNICKRKNNLYTRKGMTLVEVIISMAILAIIIVPFLTMFVQSTVTTRKSEVILDATYVAQSNMEELYSLSISKTLSDSIIQLTDNDFEAIKVADRDYDCTKQGGAYYIKIEIRGSEYEGVLVKTLVEIYENSSMDKLEAQMETILSWND
jgi:prepilin-type N-terminal cleavage/methylation domain-containing protein